MNLAPSRMQRPLIIAGNKCTWEAQTLLKDLHRIRSPLSTLFIRHHDIHPFEDHARLETLCTKYDHSLFAFGSSSKKRPFRVILGRLFDNQLLDMQEFAVKDYKSIQTFHKPDCLLGSKPLVLFQGSSFESDEGMKRSKSLLLDFFSGPRPQRVMLEGMDQVVVCSAVEGVARATPAAASAPAPAISVKRFRLKLAKSGSRLPHVPVSTWESRISTRSTQSITDSRRAEIERSSWHGPATADFQETKDGKKETSRSKSRGLILIVRMLKLSTRRRVPQASEDESFASHERLLA